MRPTRDETLMEHARVVAKRATCSRQSVGVVIAREGRVLVTGYNGAPAGLDHCHHGCDCGSSDPGRHWPGCRSKEPCTIAVHAECNAIAYAARWGIRVEAAELFTTFSPCLPCGQLIVNSGITRVVYGALHRDRRGLQLCEKAGIEVVYEDPADVI
jgi:dCMP deaminase